MKCEAFNTPAMTTDGLWQAQKPNPLLLDSPVALDGRSLAALLMAAKAGSKGIEYVDLDGNPDGDWSALFEHHLVMMLAHLVDFDPDKMRRELAASSEPLERVLGWYLMVDRLYVALSSDWEDGCPQLRQALADTIRDPLVQWQRRLLSQAGHLVTVDIQSSRYSFSPIWQETGSASGSGQSTSSSAGSLAELALDQLIGCIRMLQPLGIEAFETTLTNEVQEPAVAMLVAFGRLYGEVQQGLNGYFDRLLLFYYQSVLGQSNAGASADQAVLAFKLAAADTSIKVPGATVLTCGKAADGRPVNWLTTTPLQVNDIKASRVYALNTHRDDRVSPGRWIGAVTRIRWDILNAPQGKAGQSIAVFGADSVDKKHPGTKPLTDYDGGIGLAFASPMLRLAEGERQIKLSFELSEPVWCSSALTNLLSVSGEEKVQTWFAYLTNKDPANRRHDKPPSGAVYQQLKDHDMLPPMSELSRDNLVLLFQYYLLGRMLAAAVDDKAYWLRQLVVRMLLSQNLDWLDSQIEAFLDNLVANVKTGQSASDAQIKRLWQGFRQDKRNTFAQLFCSMFEVRVSTAKGWYLFKHSEIGRHDAADDSGDGLPDGRYGCNIRLVMSAGDPAIEPVSAKVQGSAWSQVLHGSDEPVIRLNVSDTARFYPYSLFMDLAAVQITCRVEVKGLSALKAANQSGPLNVAQPFAPFGTEPDNKGWMVVGSSEAALKPVTDISLSLHWSALPEGGLANYFKLYQFNNKPVTQASFTTTASVLSQGSWQAQPKAQAMFGPLQTGVDAPVVNIAIGLKNPLPAAIDVSQLKDFAWQPNSQGGFVKVMPGQSSFDFGHSQYESLLYKHMSDYAAALLEQAKKSSDPKAAKPELKAVPPPYTPLLNKLTLDYSACSQLLLDRVNSTSTREKFIHMSPLGLTWMDPARAFQRMGQQMTLLPNYGHDGNLFIGLTIGDGVDLSLPLSLYFDITPRQSLSGMLSTSKVDWQYLSAAGWQSLDASAVKQDQTCGLLQAGVVSLQLPADILPRADKDAKRYWLSAGVDRDCHKYGRLNAVHTHAVALQALTPGLQVAGYEPGKALTWQLCKPIAGIGELAMLSPPGGGRPAQNDQQWITTLSERLSHKGRAQTPQDYERLIAEQFPELLRVKCFASSRWADKQPCPGHLLIIVMAKPDAVISDWSQPPLVTGARLHQIRQWVAERSAPGIEIDIRNPEFDRLQVCAGVTFKAGQHQTDGQLLSHLQQQLCRWLNPFSEQGQFRHFGWQLSMDELFRLITGEDYVGQVSQLSGILISPVSYTGETQSVVPGSTMQYHRRSIGWSAAQGANKPFMPEYPWRMLWPTKAHQLYLSDSPQWRSDNNDGINQLAIGSTFVINPAKPSNSVGGNHGQT